MNGSNKLIGLGIWLLILTIINSTSSPVAAQTIEDDKGIIQNEGGDFKIVDRNPQNPHWDYLGDAFACKVYVQYGDIIKVTTTSEPNCQGNATPTLVICFQPSGPGRIGLPCLRPESNFLTSGGISPYWMKSAWLDVINRSIIGELKLQLFEPNIRLVNVIGKSYASKANWAAPNAINNEH